MRQGELDLKTAEKVAELPAEERKKVAKAEDKKTAAKKALDKQEQDTRHERDGLGALIPSNLIDTFGDPTLPEIVERIKRHHAEAVSIEKHIVNVVVRKSEFFLYAQAGEAIKLIRAAADSAAVAFSRSWRSGCRSASARNVRARGVPIAARAGRGPSSGTTTANSTETRSKCPSSTSKCPTAATPTDAAIRNCAGATAPARLIVGPQSVASSHPPG